MQIVKAFENLSYEEVQMVLVAGHGPFTWGATPEKAVFNAVVLEALAEMALLTEQINPNVSRLKHSLIQKHYQRKHGPNAYYGQK
jgi:L-ribulose-5-phosphate 4-epimerase